MSRSFASHRVVYLLLVALQLTAVARGDVHNYLHTLEVAYNATGIPWDQNLYDDVEELSAGIDFDCDTNIEPKATNVNELTPADIKVMGALGDSITAAMGAQASYIWQAFTQYRGVAWSIGGDSDLNVYTTLPNIIKKYNPNVKGFSVKNGDEKSSNARNNVAISGARAEDIPKQAEELVKKIKSDSSIDMENDWKLITLWIGGNDLCAYCEGNKEQYPESYGNYIRTGLMTLKELPRTFVNVVKILDVTQLAEVGEKGGIVCDVVHRFACECGRNKKHKEATEDGQRLYNIELQKIVDEDEFHTDDFTVVLQPFMEGVEPPRKGDGTPDLSYFGFDCFHFRTKGHRVAAAALWNNMMEPVGEKSNNWDLNPTLKCPPQGAPYFFTRKNSQVYNSFGAVPSGGDLQGDGQTASVNLLAVLLGTGVALLVGVVVVVGGVVGVLWYKRRQRRRGELSPGSVVCDNERVYLITRN